jgi:hypothetical protein
MLWSVTHLTQEAALCAILDPIFTACDAYDPPPQIEFEIDEEQLTRRFELTPAIGGDFSYYR